MQIVIDIDDRCIPWNARPIDWIKSAYENPSKCKITVLPKHGRLIDADALKTDGEITIGAGNYFAISRLQIDSLPTILESNMVEPQESEEV